MIIVSGLSSASVKSLNLRTLVDLTFSAKPDGSGTILFGSAPAISRALIGTGWPTRAGFDPVCFDSIPNAKAVYDMIRRVQSGVA